MKNFLAKLAAKFKEDETRLRRWFRSFVAWFAGVLIFIMQAGFSTVLTWDWKAWAKALVVGALFGVVGLIPSQKKAASGTQS